MAGGSGEVTDTRVAVVPLSRTGRGEARRGARSLKNCNSGGMEPEKC